MDDEVDSVDVAEPAEPTDSVPSEPMPDSTKPFHSLKLDEIPLDSLAYIRFRQDKETRRAIEASDMVELYYNSALEMDYEMPAIPQAGMGLGVGKFGPWDLYMHIECASAYADTYQTLEVGGKRHM